LSVPRAAWTPIPHEVKLCPECGAKLGRVVNLAGDTEPAAPGMLTVCVYCVAPLRYVDGGIFLERVRLDELSKEDRDAVMRTQKIVWEGKGKR
jgi:hypothetical protein